VLWRRAVQEHIAFGVMLRKAGMSAWRGKWVGHGVLLLHQYCGMLAPCRHDATQV
jgi:hypothetical protein